MGWLFIEPSSKTSRYPKVVPGITHRTHFWGSPDGPVTSPTGQSGDLSGPSRTRSGPRCSFLLSHRMVLQCRPVLRPVICPACAETHHLFLAAIRSITGPSGGYTGPTVTRPVTPSPAQKLVGTSNNLSATSPCLATWSSHLVNH